MTSLEMQTFMHHSSNPVENLYFKVDFTISWKDFVSFLPEEYHCWINCSQCYRTWKTISTLADDKGQSVLFQDNILVYPEWSRPAISHFKSIFQTVKYTDDVVYYPENLVSNDGVNFGREYSGGHEHFYLETNINLGECEQRIFLAQNTKSLLVPYQEDYIETIANRKSAIMKGLHSIEKQQDKWFNVGLHTYFKQASTANYNIDDSDILKTFCLNMADRVKNITELSSRLLRPALILELQNMCFKFEQSGLRGESLTEELLLKIKIFKLSANIFLPARERMFKNFILNTKQEVFDFIWPDNTSWQEKIACIALKNALNYNRDVKLSCKLMGITLRARKPQEFNDDTLAEEGLGKALSAFIRKESICLGNNNHRLNILYNCLALNTQKMLKLTTDEQFFIHFSSSYLEDILSSSVCAYFNCLHDDKDTMMHNTLVNFTSSKHEVESLATASSLTVFQDLHQPINHQQAISKCETGYNLFYIENKVQIKADLKDGEKIMAAVASAWKSMPEDKKAEYNKRAAFI
jgi:hypothetical protein